MRGIVRSTETRDRAFHSLWSTFALGHTETQIIEDERRSQIAQMTAMLPWVIIANLLILCIVVWACLEAHRRDLLAIMTVPSFSAIGLGLIALLVTRFERTRELPVHVHVRAATFYSACIGICSAVTLWGALSLPPGALATTCLPVVVFAAALTLIALCSLRAALLAFITSLDATFEIML